MSTPTPEPSAAPSSSPEPGAGKSLKLDNSPAARSAVASAKDSDGISDSDCELRERIKDVYPHEYITLGQHAVKLYFAGSQDAPVEPLFTHQVFPPDEEVLGYRDLSVEVRYTADWKVFASAVHGGVVPANAPAEVAHLETDEEKASAAHILRSQRLARGH